MWYYSLALLLVLTACGQDEAGARRQEQVKDSLAREQQKQLVMQELADTLSALQEIEAVNRDLLNERLAELKTRQEELKEELARLKPAQPNSPMIAAQNKLINDLGMQIAEIENEIKN
jgi:hypothetical protein